MSDPCFQMGCIDNNTGCCPECGRLQEIRHDEKDAEIAAMAKDLELAHKDIASMREEIAKLRKVINVMRTRIDSILGGEK